MSEKVEGNALETMTHAELMSALLGYFGPQRFVEIIGWITLAGLISEVKHQGDPAKLRREMEARGYGTESSLYRALRDLREFGETMEKCKYPARDHKYTMRIVQRLSKITTAKARKKPVA